MNALVDRSFGEFACCLVSEVGFCVKPWIENEKAQSVGTRLTLKFTWPVARTDPLSVNNGYLRLKKSPNKDDQKFPLFKRLISLLDWLASSQHTVKHAVVYMEAIGSMDINPQLIIGNISFCIIKATSKIL
jgi:hypothetical protein